MAFTLRQKQSVFVQLVGRLAVQAWRDGFELTFGEAYRSPEEAARLVAVSKKTGGSAILDSLHTKKLAIDLNLFRDGKFLSSTEAHQQLGEWWEKQSTPDFTCAWGGRFRDGNHYSIEHGGRK